MMTAGSGRSRPEGNLTVIPSLSQRARLAVLLAAIGGLLFDGVELGLMPVASLSVSQDLKEIQS